jgi:hypothetical protein
MSHHDDNPLDAQSLSWLSAEYELAQSEIRIDARLMEHWQAAEAELHEELMRRHNWTADRAARFASDVRQALHQAP